MSAEPDHTESKAKTKVNLKYVTFSAYFDQASANRNLTVMPLVLRRKK